MAERRKFVRVEFKTPVQFKIVSQEDVSNILKKRTLKGQGINKDISGGGIFLISEHNLSCGTILSLDINIPPLSYPIFAIGQVVRKEIIPKKKKYKYGLGIQFLNIDEDDRYKLFSYIVDRIIQEE